MPSAWNVLWLDEKLVRLGRLKVAPPKAYRLAAEIVVVPEYRDGRYLIP